MAPAIAGTEQNMMLMPETMFQGVSSEVFKSLALKHWNPKYLENIDLDILKVKTKLRMIIAFSKFDTTLSEPFQSMKA